MKHSLFRRLTVLCLVILMVFGMTSCRETAAGPYVSRPQDSMILYQKDGQVFLTNTDSATFTAEGSESGIMFKNIVPLASGSAFFLEGDVLYYKSYLEPEQKMLSGVSSIYYSLGSVFVCTKDGRLLRTEDSAQYEEVMTGVNFDPENPPYVEIESYAYLFAKGNLYRMAYGGAPEKVMEKIEPASFRFLNADGEGVYFAANGAICFQGHEAIRVKTLSGKAEATPLDMESYVSYGEKLYWTENGVLVAYDIASGKETKLDVTLGNATGRLLPVGKSLAQALAIYDGDNCYLYSLESNEATQVESADWVYAKDGMVYGFQEGKLLCHKDGTTVQVGDYAPTQTLATPDGYYFLTGATEGYEATLWLLKDGAAHKVADGVYGAKPPRAVYKYGGISYFTATQIFIMDEETLESEEFAKREKPVDFIPRSGGAFGLYADGRLELMAYGVDIGETVSEGVSSVYDFLYSPERLVTYPLD